MEELADLGFDPSLEAGGGSRAVISFTHCPFREVAVLYPDLVCQLHRGITEGILSAAAAANPGAGAGSSRSPAWWTPTRAGSRWQSRRDQLLVGG